MEGNLCNCMVEIACDNNSALYQCETATKVLPTNIPEGNILRSIYRLLSHLKSTYQITFKWTEVEGYADRHKSWDNMPQLEQLNSLCNQEAKQCLKLAADNHQIAPSLVPFEGWACIVTSQKIQGSLHNPLLHHISCSTARTYLVSK
eukprot:10984443-Ditylum_brightwellii.AAC.1